jgi:hypothetical protein
MSQPRGTVSRVDFYFNGERKRGARSHISKVREAFALSSAAVAKFSASDFKSRSSTIRSRGPSFPPSPHYPPEGDFETRVNGDFGIRKLSRTPYEKV